MKIIFATHNEGKVKEMRALLSDLKIDVLSSEEAGMVEEVEEDGFTLEENAFKKAKSVAAKTGEWVIADDSGLFIEALNGAPGIHSARWAGEIQKDDDLMIYTLDKMKNVLDGKRNAYFETALALCAPDGRYWIFFGRDDGEIAKNPRGGNIRSKLPYDQIFIPKGHSQTFAEMTDEEKNKLSHRGRAFQEFKKWVEEKGLDFLKN
ncbi:MAG: RdgB/HAM1 family non-canonical purine NTP pyrophosphatase [Patescibacteria group bacterium]